jgi:hypothetical protein
LVAETVGTAFLLAAIVGSGIMADRLSGGNEAKERRSFWASRSRSGRA